ncbi:MAG: hypothetical protein LKF43_03710 [Streptococcaceae bacterium]|jgi:hypothetical protein|nr:hypothetical protein [Streptococcaceae bacterium]
MRLKNEANHFNNIEIIQRNLQKEILLKQLLAKYQCSSTYLLKSWLSDEQKLDFSSEVYSTFFIEPSDWVICRLIFDS